MQVITSQRVIAPTRAALAAKPARSLRRASGAVAPTKRADRALILSTRAMAEEGAADDDFENRLGALRGKRSKRSAEDVAAKTAVKDPEPVKKAPPSGQRRKGVADFTTVGSVDEPAGANWGSETVVYEGPPARGEIIANVAMSWTLVWIPLTISAIGRGLWSSYKVTDKRVSVMSTSPLRTERIDVPLGEIVDVIAIGRGVGLWGDMVITLKNGEKVELRSMPEFKDIEKHIKENMGTADPEFLLER
jgi:hypothetical protein|tara:strand:- start:139 stop:882 length:744 start_codon:yes stop_codon:yes gene_type:complete